MNDTVTLIVEGKKHVCSKMLLSSMSPYFNAMFNSDFLERSKTEVTLQDVHGASAEFLFDFITNPDKIKYINDRTVFPTHIDVIKLLETANMFQFASVQDKCVSVLLAYLNSATAFDIIQVAGQLNLGDLFFKARTISMWYFDEAIKELPFLNLSAIQLEGYLNENGLRSISKEWGVWRAIETWVLHNEEERIKHLPVLIKCVRFCDLKISEMTTLALCHIIRKFPYLVRAISIIVDNIKSNPYSIEVVEDSMCIPLVSEEIDEETKDTAKKYVEYFTSSTSRLLPYVPAVISDVPTANNKILPYVSYWHKPTNRFIPTIRITKMESNIGNMVGYKVLSHGPKLYLFGGEIIGHNGAWNHSIWEYDTILNTWSHTTNIPSPGRHMFGCILDNNIYVLGGFGKFRVIQTTARRFDLATQTWHDCAKLPEPLYSAACCTFRNRVYVINSKVYMYYKEHDYWVTLDIPMPRDMVFNCAVSNDSLIFVTSEDTKCIFGLNPSIPKATVKAIGQFKYTCRQSCLIGEFLYSFSDEHFSDLITFEVINVKTGENVFEYLIPPGNEIVSFNSRHHHGCFPLLLY